MANRFLTGLLLPVVVGLAAACGGDDAPADADLTPDAPGPSGTISLSWTISNGADTIDCATAEAQFVVLDIVPVGAGAGQSDPSNCSAGETSKSLAVGSYDITIDLVDSSASSLLDAPLTQNGVDVLEGLNTALEDVTFVVGG